MVWYGGISCNPSGTGISLHAGSGGKTSIIKSKRNASGQFQRKNRTVKGVSTHGLSWYPEYVNQKAFTQMKKKWKINTVRLAVYTAEYNGYCTGDKANRKALEKKIDDGVKYADKAGLYIIIDWHILSDGNPRTYEKQSLAFLKR